MAERLRVATLNTLYYPQGDRWRQRLPLAGAALRELAADLVGLQEVDRAAARDVSLAALAPERAYRVIRASEAQRSRYPRHWDGVVTLASASVGRVEVHQIRRLTHHRIVQAIDLRTRGGALVRFANTHLHHGDGRPAFAVRARQVRALVDWLAEIGGGPGPGEGEILVGDLNATPDEPALAILRDAGFRSAYVEAHGTDATTFASGLVASTITPGPPRVCIDYVLVRGRIRVVASELAFNHASADDPTLYPSDHLGLVADLELGEATGPG